MLKAGKDFVVFLNANTAVANVSPTVAYFNGIGTVGCGLNAVVNGNYALGYIVIMQD